jgi:hypothetical protein
MGDKVNQSNQTQGKVNNLKVNWRVVQGITTIMELKMESVINQFDRVQNLMHGALMHKDQQVALAASEFWSGINNSKLEENDEIRVEKIQNCMEKILPALLECCAMQNIDRMQDMSTKENDISHVDSKTVDNDDDEHDSDESEQDNYTTLRKSSAFTLQQFSKNYPDIVFGKI